MFITAVCVLFLIKLRWAKNKSLYETHSLPDFFLRGGGRLYTGYCRIYYINLLLRQYGISVAETSTFLLYKSLTKQTVLQRNL